MYGQDDDFDSWFVLAGRLYSRLPEDWEERYRHEITEGATPFTALRSTIDSVKQEMGVDVEDVDISRAWARRVDPTVTARLTPIWRG